MIFADLYETLGVTRSDDSDTIKKAYRDLARECHPDLNMDDPDAAEKFKAVKKAYDVLIDASRKAEYDRTLPMSDMQNSYHSSPATEPIGVEINLDFLKAVFGSRESVEIECMIPCDACTASGCADGSDVSICSFCAGQGTVPSDANGGLSDPPADCLACSASGQIVNSPCSDCGGEGRKPGKRQIVFDVAPGTRTGEIADLPGEGSAGIRGAANGDVYLYFSVANHTVLSQDGSDLFCEIVIPMAKAALGGIISVPTLDGPANIDIPAGTQHGDIFTLEGYGGRDGNKRGDLNVKANIPTPSDLSSEQEKLMRQLAELEPLEFQFC